MQMRRPKAQSSLELPCALLVLVPLVLTGIDLSVLYMGYLRNMDVCRDAARAASQGPPDALVPGAPLQRASVVVTREATASRGAIRVDPNCTVSETLTAPAPTAFGGPVCGTVKATTTTVVYPPFVLRAFGMASVRLTGSQVFPYTYIVAAGSNGLNPNNGPPPGGWSNGINQNNGPPGPGGSNTGLGSLAAGGPSERLPGGGGNYSGNPCGSVGDSNVNDDGL
jgi:hypothetical protein